MRLRRVSSHQPGWERRRSGRGFRYLDELGRPLGADDIARVKSLVIPPAWREVWICPLPNGHLQAVGTDDAGRRQYLYHPDWRAGRDRAKFQRVAAAAHHLPEARAQITRDLRSEGLTKERACATAVRLLDVGYFRVGNDAYTDANGSFGLTTLERRHVRRRGDDLVFSFVGKSGIVHTIEVSDPDAVAALAQMRARKGGSRLLAHHDGNHTLASGEGWRDLTSADVNSYLADLFDGEFTAKDFRTWHAGVIAAEVLATTDEPGTSEASRKRAVKQAVMEVSSYLGNTPAIARSSYIDPRIIDLYESGTTIGDAARARHRSPTARQTALERALLDLLD
ncbi:DNA topoisomerase IB [Aestuariimicrobium sp. T2.26MG-19.2B]|uniref:DNA topoisomerase IB n=1 Tax=Aestuariimicrobium sp. T2.26MG-19.2B TaxID=3040679 RepID=UPI00247748D6|nr:DNA topoisomerase IB [Aestuariimicrobium sp. T2.26MG-19.2B]CAI9409100.1 hypothetical protein AESSP_02166 [Aestuariimicrobium sp. T2.26MG-19.2B]